MEGILLFNHRKDVPRGVIVITFLHNYRWRYICLHFYLPL